MKAVLLRDIVDQTSYIVVEGERAVDNTDNMVVDLVREHGDVIQMGSVVGAPIELNAATAERMRAEGDTTDMVRKAAARTMGHMWFLDTRVAPQDK